MTSAKHVRVLEQGLLMMRAIKVYRFVTYDDRDKNHKVQVLYVTMLRRLDLVRKLVSRGIV